MFVPAHPIKTSPLSLSPSFFSLSLSLTRTKTFLDSNKISYILVDPKLFSLPNGQSAFGDFIQYWIYGYKSIIDLVQCDRLYCAEVLQLQSMAHSSTFADDTNQHLFSLSAALLRICIFVIIKCIPQHGSTQQIYYFWLLLMLAAVVVAIEIQQSF